MTHAPRATQHDRVADQRSHLLHLASTARDRGDLSADAYTNVAAFLGLTLEPWEREAVAALLDAGAWSELNDRFFRLLQLGTGGLRGRTIAKVVTDAERGRAVPDDRPEHPAVGTNCMNARCVRNATRALVRFLWKKGVGARPRVAISFDTRHFSRDFAEETARTAAAEGADVLRFAEPASTPQLAFALRSHGCSAGVMITASHNPPYDNGYKIFGPDSAQFLGADADAITAEMMSLATTAAASTTSSPGRVDLLGPEADAPYLDALREVVLDASLFERTAASVRVVYSPLHGTGARIVPPALQRLGLPPALVAEQVSQDGRFPTVRAPNPEDPAAFTLSLATADREGAAAAFATDPDADRIGLAVRKPEGGWDLLTGNQLAALFAEYRLEALFRTGVLDAANASRATIVKTYVTTDLLRRIADAYGVRCIDTLTGFKHIGAKLRYYSAVVHGDGESWRPLSRAEALAQSTYMVLGCEESYGYLCGDYVRDKDANGAAIMIAELLAATTAAGTTVAEQLDAIYVEYGYVGNRLGTIRLEGSKGAAQIALLLKSYRDAPPKALGTRTVASVEDFERMRMVDGDGQPVPPELMLRFHFTDGGHVTVRGSGTEPLLKIYLSIEQRVPERARLAAVKAGVEGDLTALWEAIRADADARLAGSR
jgi:phosphoglucomutase